MKTHEIRIGLTRYVVDENLTELGYNFELAVAGFHVARKIHTIENFIQYIRVIDPRFDVKLTIARFCPLKVARTYFELSRKWHKNR